MYNECYSVVACYFQTRQSYHVFIIYQYRFSTCSTLCLCPSNIHDPWSRVTFHFFPLFVFYLPARLQIYHSGKRNFLWAGGGVFIETIKSLDVENMKCRVVDCVTNGSRLGSLSLAEKYWIWNYIHLWKKPSTKTRRMEDLSWHDDVNAIRRCWFRI